MTKTLTILQRKLAHNVKRLNDDKAYYESIGKDNLTSYAFENLGYLTGKVSALEYVIDLLESKCNKTDADSVIYESTERSYGYLDR